MTEKELRESLEFFGFKGYDLYPASGVDINHSFQLKKGDQQFFLKFNSSVKYPDMFIRESEALSFLSQQTSFKIPKVVGHYSGERIQWLMLEWLERGSETDDFWKEAGEKLAAMHIVSDVAFGWRNSNYIGSLVQLNPETKSWPSFYAENRLMPLVLHLERCGALTSDDRRDMETLCKKLPEIFPEEKPALLHGDLWSGNIMSAQSYGPCIYDPAIYFGHREMDIGMSLLFGGFPEVFYRAYESVYPLESGWKKRIKLTQFYPLLVHAVLFGGSYVGSAKSIIRQYL